MRAAIIAALAAIIALLSAGAAQAMVVTCTNCSETWTQAMERVTNLEELQTAINQYREAITQTQQQIALVQNAIKQYENMIQNTLKLPDQLLGQLKATLGKLAAETVSLNLQKGDLMAMGQVFDQIYPSVDIMKSLAGGLSDLSPEELWRKWSEEVDRSSQATFQVSAMQLKDLAENSSALDAHIDTLLKTPEGQMEAISAGNQLAAVQIAEAQKLRALLATTVQSSVQYDAKREKEEQLAHENWQNFICEGELLSAQGQ